jgi:hypothetical protein
MGKAELPPFGSQHHIRGVAVHLRELGHNTFADNCEAAANLMERLYAERDAWKGAYEKATETMLLAVGNHAEAEARADATDACLSTVTAAAEKALKVLTPLVRDYCGDEGQDELAAHAEVCLAALRTALKGASHG